LKRSTSHICHLGAAININAREVGRTHFKGKGILNAIKLLREVLESYEGK
jgi:hypothetical protein